MSNVIPFPSDRTAEVPRSTEATDAVAKVLPLRAAHDRRGKYVELRALIDAGSELDVVVETMR